MVMIDKFLFLGALYTEDEEIVIHNKSKVGLQNSIVKFQWNLINGIRANTNKDIYLINMLPIGPFPKYQDIIIRTKKWRLPVLNDNFIAVTLGTINIPLVKQIIISIKARILIKRWIKENKDQKLSIVLYDLLAPYLLALIGITKKHPNVISCAVIADLPNEYGYEKNLKGIYKYLRILLGKFQLKAVRNCSCFGLLTKQMEIPLQLNSQDCVVIEGFASDRDYIEYPNSRKKILLYSGSIQKIYGLENLLEAFKKIDSVDYELWLCGSGNFEEELQKHILEDHRIKFFGYLTSRETIELQNKATILINPRQNIGEYTKYSFPSKIMEYLSSGRPVIAYKLDGVPQQYYDYILSPENNSSEALKSVITSLCSLSYGDRKKIGLSGRNYVLKEKNYINQTKKLLDLINSK